MGPGYWTAKVVIPEFVTRIEDYAFEYATALEYVKFPNSLTSIGMTPSMAAVACNLLSQ